MTKWLIGLVAIFGALLLAVLALSLSGFADVPCQDGVWDAAKKTCVPTGM